MIDIENAIFTEAASELKAQYPDIYVTGEYARTPPSFPCVSIEEKSNIPLTTTRTSSSNENHAILMYEVNVYSNKQVGRKTGTNCAAVLIAKTFIDSKYDIEIRFVYKPDKLSLTQCVIQP